MAPAATRAACSAANEPTSDEAGLRGHHLTDHHEMSLHWTTSFLGAANQGAGPIPARGAVDRRLPMPRPAHRMRSQRAHATERPCPPEPDESIPCAYLRLRCSSTGFPRTVEWAPPAPLWCPGAAMTDSA